MKNHKSKLYFIITLTLGALLVNSCAHNGNRVPSSELSGDTCFLAVKKFFTLVENKNLQALRGEIEETQVHLTGESGLFKKAQMIDDALPGTNLDMAYFIFEDDYSASYLAKKLIAASKRGVKVRLIIDYFMSEKYVDWLKFLEASSSIQVKRFRPPTKDFHKYLSTDLQIPDPNMFFQGIMTQNGDILFKTVMSSPKLRPIVEKQMGSIQELKTLKASGKLTEDEQNQALFKLVQQVLMDKESLSQLKVLSKLNGHLTTFLRRMHHKITLAETPRGVEFIVGGRNISDEYHISRDELKVADGLLVGRNYPFLDSEVSGVFNSINSNNGMRSRYNNLWNSTLAENVDSKNLTPVQIAEFNQKMSDRVKALEVAMPRLLARAKEKINPADYNSSITKAMYVENSYLSKLSEKDIVEAWQEIIKLSNDKVEIISAYLYLYPTLIESLKEAVARGVKVKIYTNSVASTDLSMVNMGAYQNILKWINEIDPSNSGKIQFFELGLGKGEGSLHAKLINIDDSIIGIGSANTDPRTYLYDTNNLMLMNFEQTNHPAAKAIFGYYLNPTNNPWIELTPDKAKQILDAANKDNKTKAMNKALTMPSFINQL